MIKKIKKILTYKTRKRNHRNKITNEISSLSYKVENSKPYMRWWYYEKSFNR